MLSNYSRAAIRQNSEEGVPVMRPLFLHYEADPDSFRNNYEYMYGDDLLVAPVLHIGRVSFLFLICRLNLSGFVFVVDKSIYLRKQASRRFHPFD